MRVTVPDSFPQVLIFIAMLVPGFSFVAVRTWYVGWRSPDYGAGSRILEALYVSAIFLVIYAGALAVGFGLSSMWTGVGTLSGLQAWLVEGWKSAPAGWLALLAVVLLVVVPGDKRHLPIIWALMKPPGRVMMPVNSYYANHFPSQF